MIAYQLKKLPAELSNYKISDLADALKSLEYASAEVKKRSEKDGT